MYRCIAKNFEINGDHAHIDICGKIRATCHDGKIMQLNPKYFALPITHYDIKQWINFALYSRSVLNFEMFCCDPSKLKLHY